MKLEHRAILAFDPGARGVAIAASLESDHAKLFSLKFNKAKEHGYLIDKKELAGAFDCFGASARPLVVVEKVIGRGGWSAQSNFSFGSVVGSIIGMAQARGMRIISVDPQTWQATVHDPDAHGDPKMRSLDAYCRLFPYGPLPMKKGSLLPDHNAIDALLIAWWGARFLGAPSRAWRFS